MPYFADTYSQIAARFTSWLSDRATSDANISNVPLDYANRAQQKLWQYRAWLYLLKEHTLVFSGLEAPLPTDFGKVICVGQDTNSDGKIEFFMFESGNRIDGYKIRDTFTKASGHSFKMVFHQAPAVTPIVYYQATLADFTASGTEYSYFPGNLLLLTMQELALIDAGLVGNDLVVIQQTIKRELRDYEQAHQWVNAPMYTVQLDAYGRPINIEGYSLDGTHQLIKSRNVPSYDEGSTNIYW